MCIYVCFRFVLFSFLAFTTIDPSFIGLTPSERCQRPIQTVHMNQWNTQFCCITDHLSGDYCKNKMFKLTSLNGQSKISHSLSSLSVSLLTFSLSSLSLSFTFSSFLRRFLTLSHSYTYPLSPFLSLFYLLPFVKTVGLIMGGSVRVRVFTLQVIFTAILFVCFFSLLFYLSYFLKEFHQ